MGKIITIKNNKGGVGKTFLTAQLAAGIACADKKILILTSDPQNNIFDYLLKGDVSFKKGLKAEVANGNGEYFRLRRDLYFLPLEDVKFSNSFLKELPNFLKKVKEEFDYIFIDSIPTLKIDNIFLENSDSIVIPAYADEVTLKSVITLLDEIDITKVKAIVINRYKETAIQKRYYESLKNDLAETPILITEPVKSLSFIEGMQEDRKTIWEYSNKTAEYVQDIFLKIMNIL